MPNILKTLSFRSINATATQGWLDAGGLRFPCRAGCTGVLALKRERDGATPRGVWRLQEIRYRADRVSRPRSMLPVKPIRSTDGWCDAIGDRNYNRQVALPYGASAETLNRDDHLYDIVVILSHNRRPRVQGLGSAVFLHVAGLEPTAGCLALSRRDLVLLLSRCGPRTRVVI